MVDAVEVLRRYRADPLLFVRKEFGVEPDIWQEEGLKKLPTTNRQSFQACKGPGKTCYLAWVIWWFLATRMDPKIAATSVSGDNLRDNLWAELAKWQYKSKFLQNQFTWQKERVFLKSRPETWFASARTWAASADSQRQSDTLAGLHADSCLFVIDEAGGVPDAVAATAEAALSTGGDTKLLIAGNPSQLEGPLYRASTKDRHLWDVHEITGDPDAPNRSKRVSREWALEQIAQHGRDNPWVLVNVFGQFPPGSLNALLSVEDVRSAQKRFLKEEDYSHAAKIVGVDVARTGDDRSVIFYRQGLRAFNPIVLRNADGNEGAGRIAALKKDFDFDAVFIDATGGYGWAWIDACRSIGINAIPVQFAGKPNQAGYKNKRAEMWWLMAQWVKEGGLLPETPELIAELTTPQYFHKKDLIQIEEKDMVKERLGRSVDLADALCLCFAQQVSPKPTEKQLMMRQYNKKLDWDYNPLEFI